MVDNMRRRLVDGALFASILLNLALVGHLDYVGGFRRILMKFDLVTMPPNRAPFQVKDEERFRLLPNTPAELVFAGDSLIGDGPWAELFSDVHNRGIGGDRTDGLLARLDEILASHPCRIVFLIGSNDLSNAVPPVQILRNYRAILTRVARESPTTRVIVAALLPVNPNFPTSPVYSNRDARALDEPLRALVAEFPCARFVELTRFLGDAQGELRPEYTTDGLHLSLLGYLAIAPRIREALDGP